MPISNQTLIRNATDTLMTTGVTSGLLQPEQSRKFMRQVFETTPLTKIVRHEMRRARAGEIDKIGIAGRILRVKTENTDDGYRVKPNFGQVNYQTVMEGIGKGILRQFENAQAITNVDYDNDFLVDREHSIDDETYFNVGLQAVDSAEKLFFTITTR